jgi:DNA-binding response OmpR family regulator
MTNKVTVDPTDQASPSGDGASVLVVDDDESIRSLLTTVLRMAGFAVTSARTGADALEKVAEDVPDVIVSDVMMPDMDGFALVEALRRDQATKRIPLIFLTALGEKSSVVEGLGLGADDYIPKPFSPAELVLRVKRVLERVEEAATDNAPVGRVLVHGDLVVDQDRHEVRLAEEPVALTAVEFRLLTALLQADGRVLTRDQLLDAVYGRDEGDVLDRTIDAHVRRLRDKLGDDPEKPRHVATVRGVGYRAAPLADPGGTA